MHVEALNYSSVSAGVARRTKVRELTASLVDLIKAGFARRQHCVWHASESSRQNDARVLSVVHRSRMDLPRERFKEDLCDVTWRNDSLRYTAAAYVGQGPCRHTLPEPMYALRTMRHVHPPQLARGTLASHCRQCSQVRALPNARTSSFTCDSWRIRPESNDHRDSNRIL